MKILAIVHKDSGGALPKAALEAVAAAQSLGGELSVRILSGDAPVHSMDVPALAGAIKSSGAEIVVAPGTSRIMRSMPAAAMRAGAEIDTHITGLSSGPGGVTAQRWAYRQRILCTLARDARPWVLVVDGGAFAPAAPDSFQAEPLPAAAAATRTECLGVQTAAADAQTIRPDAKLLFVAGAGWTKKQADGAVHSAEAAATIKEFLAASGASLGSSKSLVEMGDESKADFGFMSHMNQVGQTGATPRHPKGLSTCCHGEEPHVVGWRFIGERRAVNLDANCGWAQGKADVLYVADAFKVMSHLNRILKG